MMSEDLLSLKLTQARELFKRNQAGIIVDKIGTMRKIYADNLKMIPSDVRIYMLPHNPAYRNGRAVKGYTQSLLTNYYLGEGMTTRPYPYIHPAVYNRENES